MTITIPVREEPVHADDCVGVKWKLVNQVFIDRLLTRARDAGKGVLHEHWAMAECEGCGLQVEGRVW